MKFEALQERTVIALETFDRSLVKMEGELATQSELHESFVKNLEAITEGMKELRQMFVRQGDGIDELKTMLGNYIEATQGLRRENIRLQESNTKLVSEVREKLKAIPGG